MQAATATATANDDNQSILLKLHLMKQPERESPHLPPFQPNDFSL